jgi:hypothetical protein
VDTKKLRKQSKKAAKRSRGAGSLAMRVALIGASRMLASRAGSRRKKQRRMRAVPWRS